MTEKKVCIRLNKDEIEYAEYIAKVRSKFNHPEWQSTAYRMGLCNTKKDPINVERRGAFGEIVFSKFMGNVSLDENRYDKGDSGYDFLMDDIRLAVDAKFQMFIPYAFVKRENLYGELYISATDKLGRRKRLKSDIYFFSSLKNFYCEDKRIDPSDFIANKDKITHMDVYLHGFIYKKDILVNLEERRGRRIKGSEGENYYIKISELQTPKKFRNLFYFYFKKQRSSKCLGIPVEKGN